MHSPVKNFHDRANAAALAGAAAAAYETEAGIRQWAAERGWSICEIIIAEGTETRVFIARSDGFVIVSFRGTADLRNWITDLDAVRRDVGGAGRGIEVHAGFWVALDSVWARVERILAGGAEKGAPVFFTGHSLGGALAMLAAWRFRGNCAGVYTFGQPRVGNQSFADDYNPALKDRTFRFVHSADVVARVPWLLGAYRHAGAEIFFPLSEARICGPQPCLIDPPWWLKAPGEVAGLCAEWLRGKVALLNDHRMDTYVKLLT